MTPLPRKGFQNLGFGGILSSLSFCGKRKGGKNAAKTKVLDSFSRLGCRPRRSPFTSRTWMCKICTLLSYVSAAPSAGRSRGPALP